MALAAGTRLGRYEILGPLGAGGMGEVYRAHDNDLGRDVAVKFLSARLAADPARLARFAHEARTASALNHPNIVTIHEIGELNGRPYLVMELVEGGTLRQLMNEGRLPHARQLEIAAQIADGLAKAHKAGIVHRDLKPENVMVTGEGFVKIVDFGLAKLRPEEKREAGSGDAVTRSTDSTVEGTILGTVGYMSPEQARGRPVDYRSDQFALGTILYEMACGQSPFQRDSAVQTMAAIIEDEAESLASRSPTFPVHASWIVERCLAKDPAERYASTLDLARELRSVREHLSEVTSSGDRAVAGTSLAGRRPGRVRLGRLLAGAGFVLVALVVLFFAREPFQRIQQRPLPAQKRIAVLPLEVASPDPEDQLRSEGLAESLTSRLARLEPYHAGLSVVPASDVRQAGVTTADAARRTFGATLVVAAHLQRLGDGLRLDARLLDAAESRVVRNVPPRVLDALSLQEGAIDMVASLLDLPVGPAEKTLLQQDHTVVGGAYALYLQARGHMQRFERAEDLEAATSLLQKAIEQDPNYALAYAGLGEAYWRLYELTKRPGLVPLAQGACRKALILNDLLAPVHVTLGMIERGTGQAERALVDLQRALDRDPRSADALREKGRAHVALGQTQEAEKAFQDALTVRPSDWAAHSQLGALYLTTGRMVEAEAEFRRVILLTPDNPRGYTNAGAVCFRQGRLEDAEALFRRSAEVRPTAPALSNLGTTLYYRGRYDEAAEAFKKAVELNERQMAVWLNLGRALYESPGRRPDARVPLERAVALGEEELKVNPRDAQLLADLADAHVMLGHERQARALSARALRLAPDDGSVLATVAGIDAALGDHEGALRKIARSVQAGYSSWEIEQNQSFEALKTDPRFEAALKGAAPGSGESKQP